MSRQTKEQVHRYNAYYMRTLQGKFYRAKQLAKQRGIPWELSLTEFLECRQKPCHWCGGPLPEAGSGLDRINNDTGYRNGNVVPCCRACNTARKDMDHDLYHIQRARRYGKEALYCDLRPVNTWRHFDTLI